MDKITRERKTKTKTKKIVYIIYSYIYNIRLSRDKLTSDNRNLSIYGLLYMQRLIPLKSFANKVATQQHTNIIETKSIT